MNQVPEEKKDSVTKTLAILGFVAITILIVWLAVKVVAFMPGAFSSLASIADSIYNGETKEELVVSTKNSVVNSGEGFAISWTDMPGAGTYDFQYECADGVVIKMQRAGDTEIIPCDTAVDMQNDTSADVVINTKGQRFTDVEYSIAYHRDGVETIQEDAVITIVNTAIPTGVTIKPEDEMKEPESKPNTPPVSGSAGQLPNTGIYEPETPPQQTAPAPQYVEQYIYEIPQSDPKGHVDLAVTALSVGTVNSRGVFTPDNELSADRKGALQFEIKNIGTKTASSWSYEVELPGGFDFESGAQADLKPNERVVITLGFVGDTHSRTETITVAVDAKGDTKQSNNDQSLQVKID